MPPSGIRVRFVRQMGVELAFDQCLDLQASSNDLGYPRAERPMLRDNRYALPGRVLTRPFGSVRGGDDVMRAVPLQATISGMFAADEKAATWPQVLGDKCQRHGQIR